MTATTPFLQGIDTGVNRLELRHLATKALSIGLTLWGLFGLIHQVHAIFVEYPHLPELFRESGYNTDLYREWLYRTFLMSLESLVTSAYGLTMLVKPSHLVKTAHLILGAVIGIASFAVRTHFQLPPELTQQLQLLSKP